MSVPQDRAARTTEPPPSAKKPRKRRVKRLLPDPIPSAAEVAKELDDADGVDVCIPPTLAGSKLHDLIHALGVAAFSARALGGGSEEEPATDLEYLLFDLRDRARAIHEAMLEREPVRPTIKKIKLAASVLDAADAKVKELYRSSADLSNMADDDADLSAEVRLLLGHVRGVECDLLELRGYLAKETA